MTSNLHIRQRNIRVELVTDRKDQNNIKWIDGALPRFIYHTGIAILESMQRK